MSPAAHRVLAGEVQRGDRIAATRLGPFRTVMDVTANARAQTVRIDYDSGPYDRPLLTRKLWRQHP